jgi:hypothetical protein
MFNPDIKIKNVTDVNTNRLVVKLDKTIQVKSIEPKKIKSITQAVEPTIKQVDEPMFEIY